jgi:sec-independent protein translocase protein TatA
MPNVGPLEIAVVLVIVLIIFGPKRLPELGQSMGRGIREFKSSLSGEKESPEEQRRELEASQAPAPVAESQPSAAPVAEDKPSAAPAVEDKPAEPVEGEVVTENKA